MKMHPNLLKCIINQTHKIFFPFCLRSIRVKELRKTQRWLKLIQRAPLIKKSELLNDILEETEELIKIFVASIKTAEKIKK
jgi:four helix bundle protein